jgi:hypothetical protein
MLEGFVLNNSKIYNNEEKNIFVEEGWHNSINNSLIFNSGKYGIQAFATNMLLINNSMVFNIWYRGLSIEKGSRTLLGKIYTYNNWVWIYLDPSSRLEYWDQNYYFTNELELYGAHAPLPANSFWGNWSLIDGNPLWVDMVWDYLVNVKNGSSDYLLERTPRYDILRWLQSFSAIYPLKYSYGKSIIPQSVPVVRDANIGDFVMGLISSYNSSHYIGSNINRYGWTLAIPASITGYDVIVTWLANQAQVNKYNVFSTDLIQSYIWNTINTPTTISLDSNGSDWTKKVITQIENLNNGYYATHFENQTRLDTTAPTTTDNANSTWRKTDLPVTLTAVDTWVW